MPSAHSIKEFDLPGCSTRSEVSYCRFEHTQTRTRLQEHSKALEKNRQEIELEQARRNGIQCAITHDHTYADSEGEVVSLEESLSENPVTHEQHSKEELTSDKRRNENKELNRELLRGSEDAGIPVEVGKTRFSDEIKLYTVVCTNRMSNRDGLVCC